MQVCFAYTAYILMWVSYTDLTRTSYIRNDTLNFLSTVHVARFLPIRALAYVHFLSIEIEYKVVR